MFGFEVMVTIIIVALIIGVVIGRLFGRPEASADKDPLALPVMTNLHWLIWTGTAIAFVTLAVTVLGIEIPDAAKNILLLIVGCITTSVGTLLAMYKDRIAARLQRNEKE